MSPLSPHSKSLFQAWERDFKPLLSPSPTIGRRGWRMRTMQDICTPDMHPIGGNQTSVPDRLDGLTIE